jgi:hypothetical protein
MSSCCPDAFEVAENRNRAAQKTAIKAMKSFMRRFADWRQKKRPGGVQIPYGLSATFNPARAEPIKSAGPTQAFAQTKKLASDFRPCRTCP